MAHTTLSDKIKAFLAGQLPPGEARLFEAEIARDPALAVEVELQRLEDEAMDELLRQSIDRDIPRWRETPDTWPDPPESPGKPSIWTPKMFWRVGGVLLLAVVAWLVWKNWPEENPGEKREQNFPKTNLPVAETPVPPPAEPEKPAEPPAAAPPVSVPEKRVAAAPPKRPAPTQPPPAEPPRPPKSTDAPAVADLAETNLSDYYAAIETDLANKGRRGSSPAASQFFEAGRAEFLKTDRNPTLLKNNLLQIPPGDELHPAALEMLAQTWFQEKNYAPALWAYEKYAAFDNSALVKWRLLNFRLAALPQGKDKFWALLDEISNGDPDYRARAAGMREELRRRGIVER